MSPWPLTSAPTGATCCSSAVRSAREFPGGGLSGGRRERHIYRRHGREKLVLGSALCAVNIFLAPSHRSTRAPPARRDQHPFINVKLDADLPDPPAFSAFGLHILDPHHCVQSDSNHLRRFSSARPAWVFRGFDYNRLSFGNGGSLASRSMVTYLCVVLMWAWPK